MRQLSYYVETSVWNFLLEEERLAERAITERFFRQLPTVGRMAISELVIRGDRASHPCTARGIVGTGDHSPSRGVDGHR